MPVFNSALPCFQVIKPLAEEGIQMFSFHQKTFDQVKLELPFNEIRKRARILVIDDDEEAFPYGLLQKEGYNVQYWSKIETLRDLENGEFDIIVLDIFGVAPAEMSTNDGLGVLEHLKKHNPAQLVIAYSGQKYDLSQANFWSLADDYLGKPSSLITCKEKIDALLREKFTPQHYWSTAVKLMQESGVNGKQLSGFEKKLVKSMLKKQSQPSKEMIAQTLAISHHSAATIWVLIQSIAKFFITT